MSIIYNYDLSPFTVISDNDILNFDTWPEVLDYIEAHDPGLYDTLI